MSLTKEEIIVMLDEGKTFKQIAEIDGRTPQRLNQIVNKYNKRKKSVNIETIRFQGIYDFMRDNENVTFKMLADAAYGRYIRNDELHQFSRKICGGDGYGVHFTIYQIKRLCSFTGKTFEELFKVRRDAEGV